MKKLLLLCGTSAAVVYVGTVIIGGLIRPGYSHMEDAISVVIIFISGRLSAAAMANHHPLFGLIERVTIGTFILWLFVVGRRMVQIESQPSHPMQLDVVGSISKGA